MDSLGHSSFPPTALGRQDDEEATPGLLALDRRATFTIFVRGGKTARAGTPTGGLISTDLISISPSACKDVDAAAKGTVRTLVKGIQISLTCTETDSNRMEVHYWFA
ncbi:hypothetical protein TNCV_510521 [Trichonephila clavipes]|nr:hypothetical protein TNCV_510521 [Trichonephila clavipes]